MERLTIVILCIFTLNVIQSTITAEETIFSSLLTPTAPSTELNRRSRSYYDYRYGRPLYDRLEYDRPRCGRCYDDDDDGDDDRHDDDRRSRPRSKTRNRYDSDEDDKRFDDRKSGQKNGTEEDSGDKKKKHSGSRRGDRDRHRYDDRDRYSPDYYDRFLRDPYREREYDRPYYDDLYRERRPAYERYPDRYGDYPGRYDYGYSGYRRPAYDGRYDDAFGGYGPSDGKSPHGSFRPWDETYRGQAGWDAGGRGYYFASGRPDAAPASAWGRPEYARPQSEAWQQNTGYAQGYRDPLEYRGSYGYGQTNGYRQDLGYGQASGWQSVGERRPYRDESGVNKLDSSQNYPSRNVENNGFGQSGNRQSNNYGQPSTYGQSSIYGQPIAFGQPSKYAQSNIYGQPSTHGQSSTYGQNAAYGQISSSTTPETSYLFQREDVTMNNKVDESTKETAVILNS